MTDKPGDLMNLAIEQRELLKDILLFFVADEAHEDLWKDVNDRGLLTRLEQVGDHASDILGDVGGR
jgi:hypothetical protein